MSNPSGSNAKLAIVAAVLVGLFAIVAINRYVREKTAVPETPTVCILTATEEIAAGAVIAEEQLAAATVPAGALSNVHVALPDPSAPGFAAALAEAKSKFVGHAALTLIQARTMGTLTYLLRNQRDARVEEDRTRGVVYPGTSFYETVRALEAGAKEEAK